MASITPTKSSHLTRNLAFNRAETNNRNKKILILFPHMKCTWQRPGEENSNRHYEESHLEPKSPGFEKCFASFKLSVQKKVNKKW